MESDPTIGLQFALRWTFGVILASITLMGAYWRG